MKIFKLAATGPIVAAAIIYGDKVYTGIRHDRIGHRMLAEGICPQPFPGGKAQGFVDGTGRFVDRKEAAQIAIAAGQIEELPHGTDLFAEFIFPLDHQIDLPFEIPFR